MCACVIVCLPVIRMHVCVTNTPGLRLDYFVASQSLVQGKEGEAKVVDSQVLSEFVALDHAAISLTVALPS